MNESNRDRAKSKTECDGESGTEFPIFGIGASAGGFEAILEFLTGLHGSLDFAVVIATHMDPEQKSLLAELLARATDFPVKEAEDGESVERGNIYIIPPNRDITYKDQSLHLQPLTRQKGLHLPVDLLFQSLASELKDRAICIVLSGTGSDGSMGIKAVKAAGGMTMVQSEDSAKFNGMPRSAIRTGMADFVLRPSEMPDRLSAFIKTLWPDSVSKGKPSVCDTINPGTLNEILESLDAQIGHDFRHYKRNTLIRRIYKRMVITKLESLEAYGEILKADKKEAVKLFRDLLIGVTHFFRDVEAFEELNKRVIPELFKGKESGDNVRVWVAGCSTGEEAYSLAILLDEYRMKYENKVSIQIFATDLDAQAIVFGRSGNYPVSISRNISAERLERFFQLKDGQYVLNKQIREMVVFAEHDLLQDPAFFKLDLISCRNLLIYLDPDIQKKVFPLFHYALNPDGFIFLGSAESLGASEKYFNEISKKWKIFRKAQSSTDERRRPELLPLRLREFPIEENSRFAAHSLPEFTELQHLLLDEFVPAAVLVDSNLNTIYYSGDTSPYLSIPQGSPSLKILKQVRPFLMSRLRAALVKAQKTGKTVILEDVRMESSSAELLKVTVTHITKRPFPEGSLLVIFEKLKNKPESGSASSKPVRVYEPTNIREELELTQNQLQDTISELDRLKEQSETSYEELMSVNEELQSSNEEMETSKEELQALNEELTTVNSELNHKIDELEAANNDIENLLVCSNLPKVVLNRNLKIRHYTPIASEIFNIIPTDIHRPVEHIVNKLKSVDIIHECKAVLDNLSTIEREVESEAGKSYLMRLYPYRVSKNEVAGVVLTFTDITDLKHTQRELIHHQENLEKLVEEKTHQLRASEELLRATGKLARVGGWELDMESEQVHWTEETYHIHELDEKTVPTLEEAIAFYHPEDRPIIQKAVEDCWKQGTSYDLELRFVTANGKEIWVRSKGEQRERDGKILVGGLFADVTDRKKVELKLMRTAERLKNAQAIAGVGDWEWDAEKDSVSWSEELYRIMDVDPSKEPPNYEGNITLYHPDDRELFQQSVTKALETGEPYEIELRRLLKHGNIRWLKAIAHAKKSPEGMVTRLFGTVMDITAIKEAQGSIKEAHQRLLSILDNTTDGFIELDAEFDVLYINSMGLHSLKVEEDQISGKNFWDVFSIPGDSPFRRALQHAIETGQSVQMEEIFAPIGEWIELHAYPSGDRLSLYFRVVTKRYEHEEALKRAMADAESANQAKSEFIANMSHEIRTPLNGVQGNLQLLQFSELSNEQTEYMQMAMDSCESLLTVIGDILDFSKIEAGQVVARNDLFLFESLTRSLNSTFASIATRKGLEFSINVDSSVPSDLIGDMPRIRQVLFNLVGNAVKFTQRGKIEVNLRLSEDTETGQHRLFGEVIDTGIGIEKSSIPKLFDPFTQADSSFARKFQGTGLGLSIVSRLVKLMGGSVEIKSSIGKGTTLTFDVEVGLPEPNARKLDSERKYHTPVPFDGTQKKLTVLVVEDDYNSAFMLEKMLQKLGYGVKTAPDGEVALEILQQARVDLIFLDIQMPRLDGFLTTRRIRSDPDLKHVADVPIVALTAHALAGYEERCLEAGMNAYLTKPVDLKALEKALNTFVK